MQEQIWGLSACLSYEVNLSVLARLNEGQIKFLLPSADIVFLSLLS